MHGFVWRWRMLDLNAACVDRSVADGEGAVDSPSALSETTCEMYWLQLALLNE